MTITAFMPGGNTALVAVTTSTAVAATQVCTGSQQGMFVCNPSTNAVYLAFGSSSAAASLPSTSAPSQGMCLRAGAERAFNVPPQGWLSAVTSAGTASIFATPGNAGI